MQAELAKVQPQVGIKGGVYGSCGVRVVVFPAVTSFPARAVDYSFSLYRDAGSGLPIGVAKFTAMSIESAQALQRGTGTDLYIVEGWLKPQSGNDLPTLKDKTAMRGDDGKSLLVALDPIPLAGFLLDLTRGPQKALVGIRTRGEKIVSIIAHNIQMEGDDADTYSSCLKGLLDRFSETGNSTKQVPKQN